MSDAITFKEMFDEMRRLEDCVTYFENKLFGHKLAMERYVELISAREEKESNDSNEPLTQQPSESVEKEPAYETSQKYADRIRVSRITDEQIDEALAQSRGNYVMAARFLKCTPVTLYRRRRVNKSISA